MSVSHLQSASVCAHAGQQVLDVGAARAAHVPEVPMALLSRWRWRRPDICVSGVPLAMGNRLVSCRGCQQLLMVFSPT